MLHGSGSTWFQTSCYGRADLNSEIIPESSRFFENQPKEICSNLSGKASKGVFLNTRDDLEQRFLAQHSGTMLHTKQCCKAVLCNITLSPKSSKIVVTKREERIKRKRKEKERRTRKKKTIVVLLVFIIATSEK